jgi:hypothetical protein
MYNYDYIILRMHKKTRKIQFNNMTSLKIPKGQSESVYRRRTDNTMAKKKYKRTNNDQQDMHKKLKIE